MIDHQYGVLPYRVDARGRLEILLITSKERRRWVIPKGNPIPFFLNYESAAREAFEEAGVEGRIATAPIGSFRYEKRRRSGDAAAAIVTVYPLLVTREAGGLARARRARAALVLAGGGRRRGRGARAQRNNSVF